jgi:hypothetical protein
MIIPWQVTLFQIALFSTAVSCLCTIGFVWRNLDKRACRTFAVLGLLVAIWSAARATSVLMNSSTSALWFIRISYLASVGLPMAFSEFAMEVMHLKKRTTLVKALYALSVLVLAFVPSHQFVRTAIPKMGFPFYDVPGPLLSVYSFAYTTLLIVVHWQMIKRYKVVSEADRKQIQYIFIGSIIGFGGAATTFPLVFDHHIYPLGVVLIPIYPWLLAYAIVKHRLMDITVIIRKTLIYSTVMATLALIYLGVVTLCAKLFQGLTGSQTIYSSGLAAALITLGFQPLRKRVQAFVDAKFFRQYVDREEKLYELSREVITHTTPEAMAQALTHVLSDTLHPKCGALYLKVRDGTGYVSASNWGMPGTERAAEDNPLARYFADHPQPFIQDLPTELGAPTDTRRTIHKERAA